MEHTESLTPDRLLFPEEVRDLLSDAKAKLARMAEFFRFHNNRCVCLSEQEMKDCWDVVVAFAQETLDVCTILWTGLGGQPGVRLELAGHGEALKDKDHEIIQYLEGKLYAVENFCTGEPAQGFSSDVSRKACLDLFMSFVQAVTNATARVATVLGCADLFGDRLVGYDIFCSSTDKYLFEKPLIQ